MIGPDNEVSGASRAPLHMLYVMPWLPRFVCHATGWVRSIQGGVGTTNCKSVCTLQLLHTLIDVIVTGMGLGLDNG